MNLGVCGWSSGDENELFRIAPVVGRDNVLKWVEKVGL